MRNYNRSFFYAGLLLTALLLTCVWGQIPSSAHYRLPWKVVDGGGNEGGSVSSPNYKLSSAISQPTAIGPAWMTGTSYLAHPGFRKVDLDWRPPFTSFVGTVALLDTITEDSVIVCWTGRDTTIEDGWGWGIWVYDIQISSDTTIGWRNWIVGTTDTFATMRWMGNGHRYYFRVRAHDLARNVGPWDTTVTIVDVDSVFVRTSLYTLEIHTTNELGYVWVDGMLYPAPYSGIYSPHTHVSVAVRDSFMLGDTIMAIFSHWRTTGSTDTARSYIMDSTIIDTAFYNVFYDLYVVSAHDTPVPSGHSWHAAGSLVSGYMTTPIVVSGSNWYICIGFRGTGSAPALGSGPSFDFIINRPSTITWVWDTVPAGTPLCTLYVYSPYGHPMPCDTTVYPSGTIIYATVEESVYVGGVWHYCTNWLGGGSVPPTGSGNFVSFVITETSWLVWVWDGLYLLPLVVENEGMSYDPVDGYGNPNPDPGFYWQALGSSVTVSNTHYDYGAGMQCVGYWASGSIWPPAGTDTTITFTIDEPTWVHWRWFPMGPLACLTVYSMYDAPNPPVGTSCYPVGTLINAYVAPTTPDGHTCTGYWGDGSVPTCTTATCDPTPWNVSFVLNMNSQLVWMWDGLIRFPLTVYNEGVTPTNPDGYDTPIPTVGLHWYLVGTNVPCRVTTPADSMQCIGHIGTGSATTDTSTAFTFTILIPSTVSWRWAPIGSTIVYLTVYSEYGSPDPPVGTIGYVSGTTDTAWVQDSVYVGGVWHRCTGWNGAGSIPPTGTTNRFIFTITTNSWLVWQWDGRIRWPFVVYSAHGSPMPPVGTHWYDNGTTVNGSVSPIDGTWYCIGYDGFGSLGDGPYPEFSFVITTPSGVTWLWSENVRRLIVRKNPLADIYGYIAINGVWSASAAETIYVPTGTTVGIAISNPDYLPTGATRYEFSAWADGPTDTVRNVTVSAHSEYIANYNLEHRIIVQKQPAADTLGSMQLDEYLFTGAASAYQTVWWLNGSSHSITVSSRDSSATVKYLFDHWDGGSTSPTRIVTVTAPDTFIAYYLTQYLLIIQKNPLEPYGYIYFGGTRYSGAIYQTWVNSGATINFGVSRRDTVPGMDSMYTFVNWDDGGTDTIHSAVVLTRADTFVANYIGEVYVICLQLSQYGSVTDSVYWVIGSIDASATYNMPLSDMITVRNCGTVRERLWLWVDRIVSESGAPIPWIPGLLQGHDRFVLRARFEVSPVPPTAYHPNKDYLKSTPTAATDASEVPSSIFGPAGGSLNPSQDIYLFFQWLSPITSTVYEPVIIKAKIRAVLRLP